MEKLNSVLFFTVEKLIKVYRKFAHQQIVANGYDITIDQWLVLRCLQENEQVSQLQIADLLFKDVASITRMIELLVKKEYVERKININDRRKFELTITKSGFKIIENIYPIVKNYRRQALKGLTKIEIDNLQKELEKIINNCK
jgi:MarR family transcriptional regulator for hemolysin